MWLELLEIIVVIACALTPCTALVLATAMLLSTRRSEPFVHVLMSSTFVASLALGVAAGVVLAILGGGVHVLDLGPLIKLGQYHLELSLQIDAMSVMMLCLNFLLCGLVGYFSSKYLHRDEGFFRFFMMLLLLALGVEVTVMAAGLDLMFIGWEMLGLSSALLIAFFYRRQAPVDSAFWAYGIYRITDVGLLSGIILMHHALGDMTFTGKLGVGSADAMLIGALLIFGAMGKGGIFPLTGWLPRAMEGPTSSSAIFYGALSIHVSPYLLIRLAPLFEVHMELRLAIGVLGALTMVHASMVGRVQTDAKSAMAYASAAQVGVMWVWVACGWYELAMVHMASHAVARSWQILRAPSFIQERRELERLQGNTRDRHAHLESMLPARLERALYHFALERWFLDEIARGVVSLIVRPMRALNTLDERCFGVFIKEDVVVDDEALTPEDDYSMTAKPRRGLR